MSPLKLIALGAALFGLGMTLQQLALSWVLFNSSDMILTQIDSLDRMAEEALVELDVEEGSLKESEVARVMKEIEQTFGEREIYSRADEVEGASGSISTITFRVAVEMCPHLSRA